MKTGTINGFSNYSVTEDGKVLDHAGQPVKVTGKGKNARVELKCSEDVANEDGSPLFVKGTSYKFDPAAMVAAITEGDAWNEDTTPDAQPEAPAQDDAAKEAKKAERAAHKAKTKELEDALAGEYRKLTTATPEDFPAIQAEAVRIQAELDEHNKKAPKTERAPKEEVQLTPEQEALRDVFEARKREHEDNRLAVEASKEALAAAKLECENAGVKVSGVAKGESVPSRAGHMDYDTVQNIRKDYAVGRFGNEGEAETASAIAERYGCTPTAVTHYVNYLQYKLKRGDVAYTPLKNDFYNEESGFENGAPYLEDNIKETAEKYKKPALRSGDKSAVSTK